jgi:hypothetical protein
MWRMGSSCPHVHRSELGSRKVFFSASRKNADHLLLFVTELPTSGDRSAFRTEAICRGDCLHESDRSHTDTDTARERYLHFEFPDRSHHFQIPMNLSFDR